MMPPYMNVKVRQTTTPGTTGSTLYEECVGSLMSHRFITCARACETGCTVYRPYPRNILSPANILLTAAQHLLVGACTWFTDFIVLCLVCPVYILPLFPPILLGVCNRCCLLRALSMHSFASSRVSKHSSIFSNTRKLLWKDGLERMQWNQKALKSWRSQSIVKIYLQAPRYWMFKKPDCYFSSTELYLILGTWNCWARCCGWSYGAARFLPALRKETCGISSSLWWVFSPVLMKNNQVIKCHFPFKDNDK